MKFSISFVFLLFSPCLVALASGDEQPLKLSPGFIYKIRCEGRLLISSIGNESILRLEALPRESGCGAIVKPLGPLGVTNLLIETSSGSISRAVEVTSTFSSHSTAPPRLEYFLKSKATQTEGEPK